MTGKLKAVPGSIDSGGGNGGTGGGTGGGDPTKNPAVHDVVTAALNELGKPYQLGAEGPAKFDCSGLVDWAFRTSGHYSLIGSARKRAAGYANFFKGRKAYSTDLSTARRGDVVFFAHPGKTISHCAIFLGNNEIVSALINPWGVSQTRLRGISIPPVGVGYVDYPGLATRNGATFAAEAETAPESPVEFLAGTV
jgi:cell wall-associated NlpC family hydrolase